MAITVSARCVPRSDNAFPISFQVAGVGNVYDWALAVGDVPSGPPATYADFPTPFAYSWAYMTNVELRIAPGGTKLEVTGLVNTTGSPGDEMWLALFRVTTPSGSDVPVACAGPFIIDAA